MTAAKIRTLALLLTGVVLGAAAHALLSSVAQPVHAQAAKPEPDLHALAAEIETIKGKLPSQSHAMQDVSYHFANLWFAGEHQHWDLAEFYWAETLSHLHWATRIIPLRKDNKGRDVDVKAILEGFENGPMKELHDTITAGDKPAFEKKYRSTMENCYSCHKAADKPYLRPQIPERPETPIINFDPQATWPRG